MGGPNPLQMAVIGGQALNQENQAGTEAAYAIKGAEQNKQVANQAAADARMRGARQAGLVRLQASQLAARQRVAYANSGIDVTQGTPVQTAASTAATGELDAQTSLNNAAREAWGYEVAANRYQQQEKLAGDKLGQQQLGITLGAFGQAVGAGSSGGGTIAGGGGDNSGDGSGAWSGSSGVESAFEGG